MSDNLSVKAGNPLVLKFDAIKLETASLIPPEDVEYLIKQETSFDETYGQLRRHLLHFYEAVGKEQDTCHIGIETGYSVQSVEKSFNHAGYADEDQGQNDYDIFKFSHYYSIIHAQRLIENLIRFHINRCFNYFIEKYSLSLELPNLSDLDEKKLLVICKHKEILEIIKTSMGGVVDFKGEAVRQAIIKITKELAYRTPLLKGRVVEFQSVGWGDKMTWNDRNSTLEVYDATISIFEREEVIDRFCFTTPVFAGYECAPINGEKLESYKWFKNRKLQLKFKDTQLAREYFNRFNLQNISEK